MRRSVFIKYALSYTLVLLLLFSGVTFYMIHTSQRQVQEDIVTGQVNRLNRIEGQIRGIRGMLERDAYCPDILAQAAAANAALNAFSRELLSNHIRSCVVNDVRAGNDEIVDELLDTLQKMMR